MTSNDQQNTWFFSFYICVLNLFYLHYCYILVSYLLDFHNILLFKHFNFIVCFPPNYPRMACVTAKCWRNLVRIQIFFLDFFKSIKFYNLGLKKKFRFVRIFNEEKISYFVVHSFFFHFARYAGVGFCSVVLFLTVTETRTGADVFIHTFRILFHALSFAARIEVSIRLARFAHMYESHEISHIE